MSLYAGHLRGGWVSPQFLHFSFICCSAIFTGGTAIAFNLLFPSMIALNLRPSWRVCLSVNPFSLLRSSLWNASIGVDAVISSIILSSNSFSFELAL